MIYEAIKDNSLYKEFSAEKRTEIQSLVEEVYAERKSNPPYNPYS